MLSLGNTKTTQSWALEKYAKCLSTTQVSQPAQLRSQGQWKQVTEKEVTNLQISVLQTNHVVVSGGSHVYESYSLFDAKKWIRGVVKGDSMLFISQLNNETRRFRIKFSQTCSATSFENCCDFVNSISSHVPVKEIMETGEPNSQAQTEGDIQMSLANDSQQPKVAVSLGAGGLSSAQGMTVGELGQQVGFHPSVNRVRLGTAGGKFFSPAAKNVTIGACAELVGQSNVIPKTRKTSNVPTKQLNTIIRLCLSDSNFPAFVEAVELELGEITSTET